VYRAELDRISIFPDGRCYVCSYLFDTTCTFARMQNGQVVLNRGVTTSRPVYKAAREQRLRWLQSIACMGGCRRGSRQWAAAHARSTRTCAGLPAVEVQREAGSVEKDKEDDVDMEANR